MNVKVGMLFDFTKAARERGESVCDLCKKQITETDDFVLHIPLPLTSVKEVTIAHASCWEKKEGTIHLTT